MAETTNVCINTHGVHLEFIEKGKPTRNPYVERFNSTYRTEILNYYMFQTLDEVKEITDHWLEQYNEKRLVFSKVFGTKCGILTLYSLV